MLEKDPPDPDLAALLGRAEDLARRAAAAGADEAEAYLWSTRDVEANVVGRIPSARASLAAGLGLRVVVGGSMGHAACSSLEPGPVARCIAAALGAARAVQPGKLPAQLPDPEPGRGAPGPWDPALAAMAPEDAVRAASAAAQAMAREPDVAFSSALLLHSAFAFAVASTRGVAAAERGTSAKLLLECRVRRGTEERTGNDYRLARGALDLAGAGEGCVARARASLGARRIPAGRHDVLLDPATSRAVFDLLASALGGADAQDHRSFLAGKVGQPVAAELLTVRDAPSQGGPRAAGVDDEGAPGRDKVLVEAGSLRGFLHDARSARRAGAARTGNGLRMQEERTRAPPVVAPMNLAPQPGSKPFEDLVGDLERGVLVRHYLMGMLHANAVTGDFSLAAPSAWWVERGEVRHALPPVTIAGNASEALQRLRALSRDTQLAPGGTYPGVLVGGLACAT